MEKNEVIEVLEILDLTTDQTKLSDSNQQMLIKAIGL